MEFLWLGITNITWKIAVMWLIGILLIFLGIRKQMEPALLVPMGFGAILVNLPFSGVIDQQQWSSNGIIQWLFENGIEAAEALPLLLFIGIGAMIDFGPLLSNPKLFLFGAAAQFGIFLSIIAAVALNLIPGISFTLNDAVATGVIAAADGPTAILVAIQLNSAYLPAIMVAAYSYMALVPIIQPPVIKLITTKKERLIRMPYNPKKVTRLTRIVFPILVTVIAGLVAPASVALVGFLMFGNLLRECTVLDNLSETAQKTLANLVTLLLGITVAFKMQADLFIKWETLLIMAIGLFGFIFDTVGGVMFAKFLNLFTKNKVNPMIGACGISAFPMSARVVAKMGLAEDKENHLLMHAVGANVSGQVASVIAGGVLLSMMLAMGGN